MFHRGLRHQLDNHIKTYPLNRAKTPPTRHLARTPRQPQLKCSATASKTPDVYEQLLAWAVDATWGSSPPLARVSPDPFGGRCLVADRDLAPGEVILSVPLHKVFSSKAASELDMHWSADLAFRLLTIKRQIENKASTSNSSNSSSSLVDNHGNSTSSNTSSSSSSSTISSSSTTSSSCPSPVDWSRWLACLPQLVVTPVQFSEPEVQQLGLTSAVEDTEEIQRVLSACYEVLEAELQGMGYGWEDFLWAVQVLHSRCFFESTMKQHLCVPGVDMANHSFTPSAQVHLLHNPDSCQGLGAVEEVAPPPRQQAPSCFQLIAGEDGIGVGDEVTISYGPWPQEVFLQMFGFLPTPNPYDTIVLYTGLQEAVQQYIQLLQYKLRELVHQLQQEGRQQEQGQQEHDKQQQQQEHEGSDPRLQQRAASAAVTDTATITAAATSGNMDATATASGPAGVATASGPAAVATASGPAAAAVPGASSSQLGLLGAIVGSGLFSSVVSATVEQLVTSVTAQHPTHPGFSQLVATAGGLDVRLQPGLRLVIAAVLGSARVLLGERDIRAAVLGGRVRGLGVDGGGEGGFVVDKGVVEVWSRTVRNVLQEAVAAAAGDGDASNESQQIGSTAWLAAVQSYCLDDGSEIVEQQQPGGQRKDLEQQVSLQPVVLPLRVLVVGRLQELQAQLAHRNEYKGSGSSCGITDRSSDGTGAMNVEGAHGSLIEQYRSQKLAMLESVMRGMGLQQ